MKKDRAAHPEKYKAKSRREYLANKKKILARQRKRYEQKREEIRAKAEAIREKYPERHRSAEKRYRQENPEKNAARRAKRRATKHERTPLWPDLDAIELFYECRPEGFEVDHVYPLQADGISGLHVAENLQWLPILVNKAKGNHWKDNEQAMAKYLRQLTIDVLRRPAEIAAESGLRKDSLKPLKRPDHAQV